MKWEKADNLENIKEIVLRNTGLSENEFFIDEDKVFWIDKVQEASDMIKDFINRKEAIHVVGDYDADGQDATAIMVMALQSLNANVSYRLPKRFSEGYGLSEKIVNEIDSGLIITVDNGITAIEQIKKAKEKGLSVIVIDHHLRNESGELPDADIIIDPNAIENSADFNGYCGAGLAYKVAESLIPENKKLLNKLLCFAAIGTIADVMELKSENRRIVKQGLKNMENYSTRTTGLGSILSACEMKYVSAGDIGFRIGPMLNAPGRLYDDGANISVESLIYNGKYTDTIGKKLIDINNARKEAVSEGYEKANNVISMNCLYGDEPMIVYVPGINEGIIGIIAGRIAEEIDTPTFVFTDTEDRELIKGSGRSARGVHLKNLLDSCSKYIYKYGGHAEAAGITLKKDMLLQFMEAMQENIRFESESKKIDTLYYDLEIDASEIKDTIKELIKYEPFGNGNPEIVFKINNFKLSPRYSSYYRLMGTGNSTIKLFGTNASAVWFGGADKYFGLKEPKQVDIIGKLSRNYFRDKMELQVEVVDLRDATVKVEKSALGKRLEELAKNRYKKGDPV